MLCELLFRRCKNPLVISLDNWISSVILCLTVWDGSYFRAQSLVARNPFTNLEKVIMREFKRIAGLQHLYTLLSISRILFSGGIRFTEEIVKKTGKINCLLRIYLCKKVKILHR